MCSFPDQLSLHYISMKSLLRRGVLPAVCFLLGFVWLSSLGASAQEGPLDPAPVIVSSSRVSVLSDGSGLATLQPATSGTQGALVIQGTAAAGTSLLPFELQSLLPVAP